MLRTRSILTLSRLATPTSRYATSLGRCVRLTRCFGRDGDNSASSLPEYHYQLHIDTLEETDARLRQCIREFSLVVNRDITDNATFESFGFDSLSTIELIIYVEDKLGIRMLDSEALSLKTFGDLKILAYKLLLDRRSKDKLQVIDTDKNVVVR